MIHNRGCNCSKTGCAKKYCECYSAGTKCTPLCKCVGCKNLNTANDKTDFKAYHQKIQRKRKRNKKPIGAITNTEENQEGNKGPEDESQISTESTLENQLDLE